MSSTLRFDKCLSPLRFDKCLARFDMAFARHVLWIVAVKRQVLIYIYIDLLPRRPNPFQFSLELLGLDIVFEHSRYDQQVSTSKKATAVHRTIRSSGRFRASKSFKALIESRSPTRTRLI